MQEQIIPKQTRYVTMKEYGELIGRSYSFVDNLCKTGQVRFTTSSSGRRFIDTLDMQGDNAAILARLDAQDRKLDALTRFFKLEVMP